MKRLILLVAILVTYTYATAQSAEIIDPISVVTGTVTDDELEVHWDVINSSSETVTYRARRIVGDQVAGTENRFCWGPICYLPVDDESSATNDQLWVILEPDSIDTRFRGYYNPNGNAGCTQVTYCFFDHFDESDEVCFDVTYAVDCTVGLNEFNRTEGELSQVGPNPLIGTGSFTYDISGNKGNSKVVIYNMIGEVIKEIYLNSNRGMVIVNSSDFSQGVYFYSLVSNNEVLSTKKMIVGN